MILDTKKWDIINLYDENIFVIILNHMNKFISKEALKLFYGRLIKDIIGMMLEITANISVGSSSDFMMTATRIG